MTPTTWRVTLTGPGQDTPREYEFVCESREVAIDLARYRAIYRDPEPLDPRTLRVVSCAVCVASGEAESEAESEAADGQS